MARVLCIQYSKGCRLLFGQAFPRWGSYPNSHRYRLVFSHCRKPFIKGRLQLAVFGAMALFFLLLNSRPILHSPIVQVNQHLKEIAAFQVQNRYRLERPTQERCFTPKFVHDDQVFRCGPFASSQIGQGLLRFYRGTGSR